MADVKPILLLGATGMLGRAWRELLTRRGETFDAPGRAVADFSNPGCLAGVVGGKRRLVVNCVAWTDVDGAETNEPAATRINGDAVAALADACKRAGATLVHYGTDYVFPGQSDHPYRTDDPTAPLNAYGRSKLAGEIALTKSGCRFLHLRTSWLYAPWGKNFVRTIAKAAREKPTLKVVHDQRGRPTSSQHLAAVSLALLEKGAAGIHHATDGGECTWFEFAAEIARQVNPACVVQPCTTADFPRPARRPAYSVLDLSKTESLLGPMPDWKTNLAAVMREIEPA